MTVPVTYIEYLSIPMTSCNLLGSMMSCTVPGAHMKAAAKKSDSGAFYMFFDTKLFFQNDISPRKIHIF